MLASTLEHTIPWEGLGLKTHHPPAQNLRSICRVLCLLVLWDLLDHGPGLCMNEADRTALTDGPPQLGTWQAWGEGGCMRAWEGGCVQSRVIRGNAFRASGGWTSVELDSPNPLLLGVAPGGFMSPR